MQPVAAFGAAGIASTASAVSDGALARSVPAARSADANSTAATVAASSTAGACAAAVTAAAAYRVAANPVRTAHTAADAAATIAKE